MDFDFKEEKKSNGAFDLNMPIFKFLLDIRGFNKQRADETIAKCKELFAIRDLQVIIIPSDKSDMACIWHGFNKNTDLINSVDLFISKIEDALSTLKTGDLDVINNLNQLIRNIKLEYITTL